MATVRTAIIRHKNNHSHIGISDATGSLRNGTRVTATDDKGGEYTGTITHVSSDKMVGKIHLKCSKDLSGKKPFDDTLPTTGTLNVTIDGGVPSVDPLTGVVFVDDANACP